MDIEFNNYSIDDKVKDFVENLNEDFGKIKAGGLGGGVDFNISLPTASIENRGKILYIIGGDGVADNVYICKKLADNSYVWYQIA